MLWLVFQILLIVLFIWLVLHVLWLFLHVLCLFVLGRRTVYCVYLSRAGGALCFVAIFLSFDIPLPLGPTTCKRGERYFPPNLKVLLNLNFLTKFITTVFRKLNAK